MGKLENSQILATMWDNFLSRVDKICEFYGIRKMEMAEKIGTTQPNLSTQGVHHREAYRILIAYPDISARWLLFGDGEMMEKHEEPSPQPRVPESDGETAAIYKYMYEKAEAKLDAKEKELVSATGKYIATITRLQVENEYLKRKNIVDYSENDKNNLPTAAEF